MRAYASTALALLLFAGSLTAQHLQAPDHGRRFHVFSIRLLDVPGKPVTVRSTVEATFLKDGKLVTHQGSVVQARDSRGRVYRDYKLFQPENSSEPVVEQISLFDANAGTQTFCGNADKDKRCFVTNYSSPDLSPRPYCANTPVPSDTVKWSNLGEYELGGVTVTRTRELCTHDGGEITGGQEFWRNPRLQLELDVYSLPPLEQRKMESRVTEVIPGEPDSRMFDVPEGFTAIDQRSANR